MLRGGVRNLKSSRKRSVFTNVHFGNRTPKFCPAFKLYTSKLLGSPRHQTQQVGSIPNIHRTESSKMDIKLPINVSLRFVSFRFTPPAPCFSPSTTSTTSTRPTQEAHPSSHYIPNTKAIISSSGYTSSDLRYKAGRGQAGCDIQRSESRMANG